MDEDKFVKCDKLTIEANKIFKGMVKSAYIKFENENEIDAKDDWERNNRLRNKEQNAKRKHYFEKVLDVKEQDGLRYDCETIVFEFVNGAIVGFLNSEWASIQSYKKSDLREQYD